MLPTRTLQVTEDSISNCIEEQSESERSRYEDKLVRFLKSLYSRAKTTQKKKAHSLKKAAVSLFHRYGYNRTTLALIAEEAGVSANELNRIYSTKKELFLNLYVDEKKVIRKKLNRIIGEGSHTYKKDAAKTLLKIFWQIEKNKFCRSTI